MAHFIPRRDETLEADKHQKWLQDKAVAHDKEIAALKAAVDKLLKANSTSGKQVATINARPTGSGSITGLPSGGTIGQQPMKAPASVGGARWVYPVQGQVPEYFVSLDPAGASYSVTGMSMLYDQTSDEAMSLKLLPSVWFSNDGTELIYLNVSNYPDWAGDLWGQGEFPLHLTVEVNPTVDDEVFIINLPTYDSIRGVSAPFFTFGLTNPTGFSARVYINGPVLYYAGTSVPVLGSIDSWVIEPGESFAWHVLNVKGAGSTAIPVRFDDTGTSDAYYDANVLHMRHVFNIRKDGALSVAALPGRVYNDTVAPLTIGKITAPIGTAPSGVAATFVVKKNGSSISSSFSVAAGANTGTAVLTDTAFAPGDYLTVECTQTGSAADVNVHIYAG